MPFVTSDDARIYYEVCGDGPDVVLIHPFPVNHRFWDGVIPALERRYRLVLPDFRGMGQSEIGNGPATVQKCAEDIRRVCDDAGVTKAVFGGVSMAGYILFEFWRRHAERVRAVILANTRAGADSEQVRNGRLRAAKSVFEKGPESFLDGTIPNLFAASTRSNRPDVVQRGRDMMRGTRAESIAQLSLGMADRPDSIPTLSSVKVPVLLIAGEEDTFTPPSEAEMMRQHLPESRIEVVPRAGHYAAFEQPEVAGKAIRNFVDSVYASGP